MATSMTEVRAAQVVSQHIPRDLSQNYRVELAQDLLDEQGQLIDWLIGFAFETLGTRVLDLRVVPSEHIHTICES
jgi:hypothetical protein